MKIETGIDTQIWAARSIAKVFDKLKLSYERTAKSGEPSFTKNFLSNHKNPIIQKIAEARKINKVNTTFIDTILKHEYRDISISVTGTPQSYPLSSGIVQAFNQGTGTDQVSPVTGLTYVEDSLLRPWEKAYRIQNKT